MNPNNKTTIVNDNGHQSSTVNPVPHSSFMHQAPQTSTANQSIGNFNGASNGIIDEAIIELNKIQTFVFFDLETSGFSGMDCRILELSMIAVSREDLLNMKNNMNKNNENGEAANGTSPVPKLPRVLHKYSRLYYPRKIIRREVEEVTGLSNELLHRLPGFTSSSAQALNLFLDLPKPVSLVAHNGNRFDFPLLLAELQNVIEFDSLNNLRELQCTDSLIAFRAIDADMKLEREIREIAEISSLAESFSFDDMDDDEIMDFEPERKRVRCVENGVGNASRRVNTPSPVDEGELVISADLPVTPMKDQCIVTSTPITPAKAKIPPKPPITPEFNLQTSKIVSDGVRRSLTYGMKKRKWDGTKPYKQVNLYKRLFGGEYNAHRAEADCQALLEICGFYSEQFVNWADSNCTTLSTVKPMWGKRKTFRIGL